MRQERHLTREENREAYELYHVKGWRVGDIAGRLKLSNGDFSKIITRAGWQRGPEAEKHIKEKRLKIKRERRAAKMLKGDDLESARLFYCLMGLSMAAIAAKFKVTTPLIKECREANEWTRKYETIKNFNLAVDFNMKETEVEVVDVRDPWAERLAKLKKLSAELNIEMPATYGWFNAKKFKAPQSYVSTA